MRIPTALVLSFLVTAVASCTSGTTSPRTTTSSRPSPSWTVPEVPYLWPENWARPGDPTPAGSQTAVDGGRQGWRTKPAAVAGLFAKNVLGWPVAVAVEERSGLPGTVWTVLPCGRRRTCRRPASAQHVWLQQPGRTGPDGIWSVSGAWVGGLDVGLSPSDAAAGPSIPGGNRLAMDLRFPGDDVVTVGMSATNGCATYASSAQQGIAPTVGHGRLSYHLPEPGASPPTCSPVAAAYVYAYTVPALNQPTGDPFLESGDVAAVTALPFFFDVAGEAQGGS